MVPHICTLYGLWCPSAGTLNKKQQHSSDNTDQTVKRTDEFDYVLVRLRLVLLHQVSKVSFAWKGYNRQRQATDAYSPSHHQASCCRTLKSSISKS